MRQGSPRSAMKSKRTRCALPCSRGDTFWIVSLDPRYACGRRGTQNPAAGKAQGEFDARPTDVSRHRHRGGRQRRRRRASAVPSQPADPHDRAVCRRRPGGHDGAPRRRAARHDHRCPDHQREPWWRLRGIVSKFVAGADPDGYTLLCGSISSLVIQPVMTRNRDFIPRHRSCRSHGCRRTSRCSPSIRTFRRTRCAGACRLRHSPSR